MTTPPAPDAWDAAFLALFGHIPAESPWDPREAVEPEVEYLSGAEADRLADADAAGRGWVR